ncbi:DUF4129 domain-containing protein (plasmid) [Halorussus limi]|uniref:DUF4129 domain-containing protein n=1 Tax=Halorussus limi TaxID=2938695 RepID=A0A8U0I0E7_9EURY|nr:DUF4129 domain-containing protein [Halorussus limi]UPV76845.1 DUF4129 domain-containing protein [Halorussus limi]
MKADSVLTVVVALCCVLAIGATSTTLDSTVSTDPEEVTNFDYDKVPIGTGQAKKLDDAIDGGRSASGQSGSGKDASSESGSSGDEKVQAAKAGDAAENGDFTRSASGGDGGRQDQAAGSGENQHSKQSGGSGNEMQQSGGANSQSGEGNGTGIRDQTLLERLLSLLRDLLDLLSNLLPYLVLAVLFGAAVRYRDRILARISPGETEDGDESEAAADREPDPQNDIAAAWFEMVERLDLADRRDLTPRECAAAAKRRGVDDETARKLTALFEEVRYGGARVTDERRRRAERTLDSVRSQLEVRQ